MAVLSGADVLREMAQTYEERNAVYKDNFRRMGPVMVALFPQGFQLITPHDFMCYHFLDWAVGKLTRFASTGLTHVDSLHDAAVYLAMLEAELRK